MKNFLKNKWHLHCLTILISAAIHYGFANQKDMEQRLWFSQTFWGVISVIIISVIVGFFVSFLWEWGQGKWKNAHIGKAGTEASRKDYMAGTYASFIGAILSLFIDEFWLAGVTLIVIGLLHVYKLVKFKN